MKTLQIKLTDEEHRQLKIAAAIAGLSLKQLILTLVSQDKNGA
jgi:hypothetical protein